MPEIPAIRFLGELPAVIKVKKMLHELHYKECVHGVV
jgi:hypothetical protein